MIKFKPNSFGLKPQNEILSIGMIEDGETVQTDISCIPNENGNKEAP